MDRDILPRLTEVHEGGSAVYHHRCHGPFKTDFTPLEANDRGHPQGIGRAIRTAGEGMKHAAGLENAIKKTDRATNITQRAVRRLKWHMRPEERPKGCRQARVGTATEGEKKKKGKPKTAHRQKNNRKRTNRKGRTPARATAVGFCYLQKYLIRLAILFSQSFFITFFDLNTGI